MPQVKINVNGEKFILSGMSRSACRKQLLFSLAKINSKVKETHSIVNDCSTEGFISESAGSKQTKVLEKKSTVVGCEDVYKTLLILGKEKRKQKESNKYGKLKTKRSSRKSRNAHKNKQKQTSNVESFSLADETVKHDNLLRSKDSQKERFFHGNVLKPMSDCFEKRLKHTRKLEGKLFKGGNYEYLNDLVNEQKKCLKTQRHRIKEKEKKIKHYCRRLEKEKAKDLEQLIWTSDSVHEANKETSESLKSFRKAADTDHDTGISEQHSSDVEATYELNYVLKNKQTIVSTISLEKEKIESKEREQRAQEIMEATAGEQICRSVNENLSCETSEEMVTTSVVNLENKQKTYPSHDVKAKNETEKIHADIKLLQSQLEEQNRLINLLNDLVVQDKCFIEKGNTQLQIVDEACLEHRLKNLRSSIALSIELYEYQKSEMETNADTLRHTEREIRRKRWHVDSLRKHLNSLTMCTHSSKRKEKRPREKYYRVNGTLV